MLPVNALSLVGLGMHLSFLDVLPFWDSSGLDPKVAIFESVTMPGDAHGVQDAVYSGMVGL